MIGYGWSRWSVDPLLGCCAGIGPYILLRVFNRYSGTPHTQYKDTHRADSTIGHTQWLLFTTVLLYGLSQVASLLYSSAGDII